jgi:hypothetical protein
MKEIPGYEGLYACDKNGKVYSLPRTIHRRSTYGGIFDWKFSLKQLSACTRKDGYLGVALLKNGKRKSYLVHRLVGVTFLELGTDQELNHIDGNKKNNFLENLEICSRGENIRHAFRIGLRSHKGKNHPQFFITDELKDTVVKLLNQGLTQSKIAIMTGITQTSVSKIKLNKG